MRTRSSLLVLGVLFLVIVAWAPWIGEDYAKVRIVKKLGGPEQSFNHLGDIMPLRDVPIEKVRVPFGILVYFLGEAVWFVTLWGAVL